MDKEENFCRVCGNRKSFVFQGEFSGQTGKKIFDKICLNSNCDKGKEELIYQKQKECKHEYKWDWVLFFPDGKTCEKCGNYEHFGGGI